MAAEIQYRGPGSQRQCYHLIRNQTSGYIWSASGGTGGFESIVSGNYSSYALADTEQGVSNVYVGNAPTALPAGDYAIDARQQVGGSPAWSDPGVAAGDLQWNGSKLLPLSDLATSGQLGTITPMRIARGTMVVNFPFYLKSAADHITPFVSGIVSGQISRDGGSFGALQSGNATEIGLGWYRATLTSGDLLANTVALQFSANGVNGGTSDTLPLSLILQRVSGQG